jgi:hypothetical protein
MSDRIEPIRRDDGARAVPAVAPVARRNRSREEEPRRKSRQAVSSKPTVTRDDDGTPHVDVRA